MNVDKRIIEPFNAWWRQSNHCEPSLAAVKAFEAGFKAALEEVRKATSGKYSGCRMSRDDQIGLSVCIPMACGCAWNHSAISLGLILFVMACAIWITGRQSETGAEQ